MRHKHSGHILRKLVHLRELGHQLPPLILRTVRTEEGQDVVELALPRDEVDNVPTLSIHLQEPGGAWQIRTSLSCTYPSIVTTIGE